MQYKKIIFMKFLTSDIIPILQTLLVYDIETKKEIGGLLTEKLSLSLKRRLQKIRTDTFKLYQQLVIDEKEIRDKATPETLNDELNKLFSEEVEIQQEYADIKFIEAIETTANYDFSVIEKFAK
jgi:hypothetical protein